LPRGYHLAIRNGRVGAALSSSAILKLRMLRIAIVAMLAAVALCRTAPGAVTTGKMEVSRQQTVRPPARRCRASPGMLSGMAIDFGRTADDYARHRAGFPSSMFERLGRRGIGKGGQRVVDVGTGTGTLARGFALRGCEVIGIDPSEQLVEQARRLDAEAGVTIAYRIARAEETGLDDGSVDVYAAGQCWHWFDRPRAAIEARRVLVAGGAIVICHFDWLPLAGNVVEATEALILAHNPLWPAAGGNGMYPRWARDVAEAGFGEIETFSYDVDAPYTHESWRGRIRASAGVAASLDADAVGRFDDEHARMLASRFADDPLVIPHRVWALTARSR
jgi:SAM-dependent methyltransferase